MVVKKYKIYLLGLIILAINTSAPVSAFANPKERIISDSGVQELRKYQCNDNLLVDFDDDERLFTFMAWLNWISNNEKKSDDEIYDVRDSLKDLPKDLYDRSKEAYNKYLYGNKVASFSTIQSYLHTDKYYGANLKNPTTLKNGLLMYNTQYYDYPDTFNIKQEYIPFDEQEMSKNIPSTDLMREFYQKANIKELWEKKYKRVSQDLIFKYAEDAKELMSDTMCFLKAEQKYPVSIRFNTLNSFGISGQTSFSDREKKYIIKVNLKPEYSNNYVLQIIRHEFTHTLLNQQAERYSSIIEPNLRRVAAELNLKDAITSPDELLAQCVENLNFAKSELYVRENAHYYYKNLLFMHFIDKIPEYLSSGKSYEEFIPELFASYDPEKEIERWKKIEKRIKRL